MMTFLVTGTAARPCPILGPAGLCSTKTGTPHHWRLLMSLALLGLVLLCARPAHAQYPGGYPGTGSGGGYPTGGSGGYPGGYPGGGWTVTDKVGNPLPSAPDGSGYTLRGPMTGTCDLTGAYKDVLAASRQPNSSVGCAFTPNPSGYQFWLLGSGATPPGGGYNPYNIWTQAAAPNYAATPSGSPAGWLGQPWNESVNGSITANTGGTLWAIFQWSGGAPPVDHLDILLRTIVSANADPQGNGLTSSATATDSTFNETASAPGGVSLVKGRHLLRVPVDSGTGQA